jgi:aminopeptidase N
MEFVKKNKAAVSITASIVLALGFYKLYNRHPKAVMEHVRNDGFIKDPKYKENFPLYKEEAEFRKKILGDITYDLVLALKKGEIFDGQLTVTFDVHQEDFEEEDLFIDFHGLGIKDALLNDFPIDETRVFNGHRILLLRSMLKLGDRNTLSLVFKSEYVHDNTGLHHFLDQEDEGEYIYSQFEPFFAHKAFPCFNQPDLRAVLKLMTLAPADWKVISAGLERGEISKFDIGFEEALEKISEDIYSGYDEAFHIQYYSDTPKITPYIYSFIAGPYEYIERKMKIPGRLTPLPFRMYYRKTLKNEVEKVEDLIFECAVNGIEWYSKFFGQNYPYEKYYQIFCPEFKFGAMENLGNVTLAEFFLPRGKELSEADRIMITNIALHELCHHWFGNLTTMTWWNDLWLNESFATYVSFLCMEGVDSIKEQNENMWIMMNSHKHWGYNEDDLPTNHPICKKAPHTDSALDMINGITYGKGGAFLKQLFHLIGYDAFSLATKLYFDTYKWENTVLKDFLE